jgi:hypothetical protein
MIKTVQTGWPEQNNKHRWARLLKQQLLITVLRLLTKEKKFPFSVSSKQTEVCHDHFLFAVNKRKLPFAVHSVFCLQNSGTWRHGNRNRGAMETWSWRHGDIKRKIEA